MQTKFQLNICKYVALVPLPPNSGSSFQESPLPLGAGGVKGKVTLQIKNNIQKRKTYQVSA